MNSLHLCSANGYPRNDRPDATVLAAPTRRHTRVALDKSSVFILAIVIALGLHLHGGRAEEEIQANSFKTMRPYVMNIHEKFQSNAYDRGPYLAIPDVHPDEQTALNGRCEGRSHWEFRLPAQSGGDNKPGHTEQFQDAKDQPHFQGNAPRVGASALILLNMKTFITPDAS